MYLCVLHKLFSRFYLDVCGIIYLIFTIITCNINFINRHTIWYSYFYIVMGKRKKKTTTIVFPMFDLFFFFWSFVAFIFFPFFLVWFVSKARPARAGGVSERSDAGGRTRVERTARLDRARVLDRLPAQK